AGVLAVGPISLAQGPPDAAIGGRHAAPAEEPGITPAAVTAPDEPAEEVLPAGVPRTEPRVRLQGCLRSLPRLFLDNGRHRVFDHLRRRALGGVAEDAHVNGVREDPLHRAAPPPAGGCDLAVRGVQPAR